MPRKNTPGPPERLRILGKTWTVEAIPTFRAGEIDGECQIEHCRIVFAADGHPDNHRETVLHEVIHAVDLAMQLELEERQVHALAAGLLAVLRDNRRLNEWLMGGEATE